MIWFQLWWLAMQHGLWRHPGRMVWSLLVTCWLAYAYRGRARTEAELATAINDTHRRKGRVASSEVSR
jgi:hypothetical protein